MKGKPLFSRLQRWIFALSIFFLVIMSLARLAMYLYFRHISIGEHQFPAVMWMGIRYDMREIGIMAVLMILLSAVPFLHPFYSRFGRKFHFALWFIALIVFSVFYTVDAAHFAYLHVRLNAHVLEFLQNPLTSLGMIWETYPVIWMLVAIIVFVFLCFQYIRYTFYKIAAQPEVEKRFRWVRSVILFLFFGGWIFGRIGQFPLRWSDAFTLKGDFNAQIALNPFQSFFSTLAFRNSTFDTEKARYYYPMMAAYLGVDHPDSVHLNYERYFPEDTTRPAWHPNIVLVICESFSGYKSSLWGNPLNTTPFIDSIAQHGIFFDHCFTPSFGTARGVWAVITGLPDVEVHKTASRNPQIVDQHTIINAFKGYRRFYFIGGSTSWANIRGLLDNNIDSVHIYEEKDYSAPRLDVWGISDKNLFLEANKILRTQTRPFFAIIQTSDNHRPYSIPDEDLRYFHKVNYPIDTLKKYGFFSNEEFNAFRYFDFCVKTFLDTASREPYFRNTIFAFIGDHGINGDAGNMFPRAWTDQRLTSEHVPFIIYAPALLKPERHSMIASQVDVLPTLAGLANVSYHDFTLGRDLLHLQDTMHNMAFIIERDNDQMGLVNNAYYLKQSIHQPNQYQFVSILNNNPIPQNAYTDSVFRAMRTWMYAFYETARYMTYHNKKQRDVH
ncbi:MAG: sulfatase-like hydrolase/transferase [Thermoflavifilum aggregans]|nr:sulfatase-like hydrolase/transferase [Thermoflavifilum aggregans]